MNVYSLRKAILTEMKRAAARRSPMSLDDLLSITCESAIEYAAAADTATEWSELELKGYLEPIPGFGGKYLRITEKGLNQLSLEYPQDTFIHGHRAV